MDTDFVQQYKNVGMDVEDADLPDNLEGDGDESSSGGSDEGHSGSTSGDSSSDESVGNPNSSELSNMDDSGMLDVLLVLPCSFVPVRTDDHPRKRSRHVK